MEWMRSVSPPARCSASRILRAAALLPLPGGPRSSTAIFEARVARPGCSSRSATDRGGIACCTGAAAAAGALHGESQARVRWVHVCGRTSSRTFWMDIISKPGPQIAVVTYKKREVNVHSASSQGGDSDCMT